MEFPSIGKICSFEGCGQLDFLPFLCGSCGERYCLNHRYPTSHQCPQWGENEKNVHTCETCSSMVLKSKGKSIEKILEEHLQSNCSSHLLSSAPIDKKRCFIKECRNISEGGVMVHVVCDGCGEIFCLKHRHPPTHQCASLNVESDEKSERRIKAEKLISKYKRSISSTKDNNSNLNSSSSSSLTKNTISTTINNKPKKKNKMIEVMKLKSKAQGDSSIPSHVRLYLSVDFPRDSKVSNKPMFFNKEWPVGKVLDKITSIGKISNINNKLPLDDPSRLVLFNKETENLLEMNKKLSEVVESGDNISLEKYESITFLNKEEEELNEIVKSEETQETIN